MTSWAPETPRHTTLAPSFLTVFQCALDSLQPGCFCPLFSSTVMSHPETLDDHNSEEQESRALLPARRSQAQQHVGNAAEGTGVHVPGQQEDLSALNDREVWRHFESIKRSANLSFGRISSPSRGCETGCGTRGIAVPRSWWVTHLKCRYSETESC